MKSIASTILLLISYHLFSQSVILEGEVIDANTKKPLPFATIEIFSLKTGTIADEKGKIVLFLDSADICKNDTITFSHLGYKKAKLSIKDFAEQKKIELKEAPINLSEVLVLPKKYKIAKLGIFKKKPHNGLITNFFFNKIGIYLETKKAEPGWLISASFYIYEKGHSETPFRVRVFDLDKENNCPGKDILTEDVIVTAEKPGWFKVDLTDYNIRFPSDGFFVMMEWLNHGEKFNYYHDARTKVETGEIVMKKRKFYGQTLGYVIKQPKILTWCITSKLEWVPRKLYKKKYGYTNAMINVEVAYEID